jgi:hypothetical protein
METKESRYVAMGVGKTEEATAAAAAGGPAGGAADVLGVGLVGASDEVGEETLAASDAAEDVL